MGGPASIARVVHMILQRDTRLRGFYAPRLLAEPPQALASETSGKPYL